MATRTIGTELVLQGEKEFNQQMKAVNAGLKTTKSDMAALSSSFGDNANSMENLRKKQKLLQTSVDQHKAKVDALEKQYKAAAKQYGENSAMAQKYKQDINNATAALNKETAALEKNADAMKKKFLAALNSVGAGSKKVFSVMGSAASGMGKMVGSAAAGAAAGVAVIGAASVAAVAAVVGWANEQAEAAKVAYEAGETLSKSQTRWLEYSNQLDSLSGAATNAKGAIAEILLPTLNDLATQGTEFLTSFTSEMAAAEGDTAAQSQLIGQYIAKGAENIMLALPGYVESGKNILGGIVAGFSESGPELLDMGLTLIMDLLESIMQEAPKLANAGLELVMQLIDGIDGQSLADSALQMVDKLVDGLADAAPKLIPAALTLVLELAMGLVRNIPKLLESGGKLIMGLLEGIWSGLGQLAEMGGQLLQTLIDGLKNSDSSILRWCGDFIESIIDGITAVWDNLVSWFNGLWDSLFGEREVDVDVNTSTSGGVDGSHANGLRYVPYDGYLAELHRGEQVLTAQEADAYRSGQAGGKIINVTINTTSVSPAEIDMIVEYANGKLGEGM